MSTGRVDMGAMLREAVEEHCKKTGVGHGDVARAAGILPESLSRAMRRPNASGTLLAKVLEVTKDRVELVPDSASDASDESTE